MNAIFNLDPRMKQAGLGMLLVVCCIGMSGCTALFAPIDSIPAGRVPVEFLMPPRSLDQPIDLALLGQAKPESYILDEADILGVFIEGVLGGRNEAPPVQMPGPDSDLPPSMGFPVPIREDGTVSLPILDRSVPVRGLSVAQAEQLIKQTYFDEKILVGSPRILVTLMRKRTYRVFVVRQDNGFSGANARQGNRRSFQAVTDRSDESSRGAVLQLPAYENDVINALTRSGGLPGVNAKSDIKILRASRNRAERQRRLENNFQLNQASQFNQMAATGENVVTIPLRLRPGQVPRFRAEDVILNEGDIVYVESRESEVYYTGGLLGGGEWNLPRDYDLDVLAAASLAGNAVGLDQQVIQGGLQASAGSRVPPTQLIVLRRLPNNQQIAIEVDLNVALNDPASRLLVAPGDTLILRHTPREEVINFALGTFFTFGIRELFR